ncbi:MAG: hypothetical protein JNM90_23750, partial [Burkholderiales bacterium]|nr:hypothetical protein [Burkholderiales bacterium]
MFKGWRLVVLVLVLASAHPAKSAQRFWDTAHFWGFLCGGQFSNVDCWGAGGIPAPGNVDIATWNFAHATTYSVLFGASVTNQKARIRTDDILWDLGGKTYTLTQDNSVTDPSLAIGISNGETGRLSVRNGSVNSARTVLAINGSSNGFLTLNGSATTFNAGTGLTVGYWEYSRAGVSVLGGSSLTSSGTAAIGFHATASGSVTVGGSGSNWIASDDVNVGSSSGGSGKLAVHSGARMRAGAVTVWNGASSIDVTANGGGTVNVIGQLGLQAGARATSLFTIIDKAVVLIGGGAGGILSG